MANSMCSKCETRMTLVKKTRRWALYECPSCGGLLGRLGKRLRGPKRDAAEREMDSHARVILDKRVPDIVERLKGMGSEELHAWFLASQPRSESGDDSA